MPTHLSNPILENVASFFRGMEERDRETFLLVWDQWLRCAAHLRQYNAETNAAKGLFSIQPFQKSLNVAVVLDVETATYRSGVAYGLIHRSLYPDPGSNKFKWPAEGHTAVTEVLPGDTLYLTDGSTANPIPFTIKTVLADGVVTDQAFESEQSTWISYRVDRGAIPDPEFVGCAEVFPIADTVKSIPLMATTVTSGGHTLVEGADYVVKGGFLGFYSATPRQHEGRLSFFFAPEVIEDEDLPYQVFGYPIGFRRESSDQYVRGLQALWFALWSGPTPKNIGVGVSVLFGLPFTVPGRVTRVMQKSDGGWEVEVDGKEVVTHVIPPGFSPNVKEGDEVGFQSLTDASRVVDYISDPRFVSQFGLEPAIVKFHTFFVLIQHSVLRKAYELGSPDLDAVSQFVQRIKDVRTDFYLLIELPITDAAKVSSLPPSITAVIRPSAEVGPNWANRMRIDHFASPGLAHIYGYRDNYIEETRCLGTVVAVRDSNDTLTVVYDDAEGKIRPETGALPGKYVVELDCSLRLTGSLGAGVLDGTDTVVLLKASFPDWAKVRAGDIFFLSGSAIQRNMEPYTISSVEDANTEISIQFDRDTAAEDGLSFEIKTLYPIKANTTGDVSTIRLEPVHLSLDGLDPESPGGFALWRKWPGGEAMRQDYEGSLDTGRYDFSDAEGRAPMLLGSDALQLTDRVKITAYAVDESEKSVYDERDLLGDPRP